MEDYVVFEGKKSVRAVGKKSDREFFDYAEDMLGFKTDIDLVTFCAALALRLDYEGARPKKRKLFHPRKLVGMESFEKRTLYDNIILEYLGVKENRLEAFETLFYTGLRFLKTWFDDVGTEYSSELERFCGIWEEVNPEGNAG